MPVPQSAHDADRACSRPVVRLDARTRLVRNVYEDSVSLRYQAAHCEPGEFEELVRWFRDGATAIMPGNAGAYDLSALRRIRAALPGDWTIQFRPRLRPRLVYRGVYAMAMSNRTFLPNGDLAYGTGRRRDVLTLDMLNREADEVEGVVAMRSRRRTPRPLPAYATRYQPDADLRNLGISMASHQRNINRAMEQLTLRPIRPLDLEA